MPRRPSRKKPSYVAFQLRVPPKTLEAFERARQAGIIRTRSRNEAIVRLIEGFLADVSVIIDLFEDAEKFIENDPALKNAPPEYRSLQIAGRIMQSQRAHELTKRVAEIVTMIALSRDTPEFEKLVEALKALKEGEGEDK